MINGLDLFTGYGGITLALMPWVRPLAYCERERYAQGILLSRMATGDLPEAPIWDDVRTFEGGPFKGRIDIIYGGFPCQDISVAGLGKGMDGERSGLFREIVRLAEEIEPTFLFLENVPAIRTRGLDVVVQELTKAGYDLRWTMLSASEVGAPHKRERWFLLANARGGRFGESSEGEMEQPRRAEAIGSSAPSHTQRLKLRNEQGWRSGSSGERSPIAGDHGEKESLADTDSSRFKRKDASQSKRRNRCVESPRSRTELANTDFQSLEVGQSWKSGQCSSVIRKGWWEFEPDVGGSAYGIATELDADRGLGGEYSYQKGVREVLSYLRDKTTAEALWKAVRGLECFRAEEALLSFVREFERRGWIRWEQLEGEDSFERFLRTMPWESSISCSPCGSESIEQFFREYPDAMRELSQLVASRGKSPWDSSLWESATDRTVMGRMPHRVDRIKALGNGVVPLQVRTAFEELMGIHDAEH